MLIGVSTNCDMASPLETVLERLAEMTDLVEIQCDANHSLFRHAAVCDRFDLRYTIHAPTGDGNIAAPLEPIRRATVAMLAETAAMADAVGAEKLVIHPGFCMYPDEWDASVAALYRSLAELGEVQGRYSVQFVIENMGSWTCCHFRTPELLPVIRGAGLGFALDVGHAHLCGTLSGFLAEHPDHVHLHDNHGCMDEHAACGSGMIHFSEVMRRISGSTAVVEVIRPEDVRSSLAYLKTASAESLITFHDEIV